jgi:hypothetical protein
MADEKKEEVEGKIRVKELIIQTSEKSYEDIKLLQKMTGIEDLSEIFRTSLKMLHLAVASEGTQEDLLKLRKMLELNDLTEGFRKGLKLLCIAADVEKQGGHLQSVVGDEIKKITITEL